MNTPRFGAAGDGLVKAGEIATFCVRALAAVRYTLANYRKEVLRQLADSEGLSVLLLEQNVGQALRIVDRVYVMRSGRVLLEETAEQMRARDSYWDLF